MSDEKNKVSADWPADEAPPTEEELAQAARLAGDLDGLLAGKRAGGGDEVLAAAVMVRAAQGTYDLSLPAESSRRLLDDALHQALTVGQPSRLRRAAPLLAMAATLTLVISAMVVSPAFRAQDEARPAPPREQLSRPSDALMNKPFTDRAGASERLDRVFADRLRGYRTLALAGGGAR